MTANQTLDGKAVIVTGATTEPGRGIVAALAQAGANIAAVDEYQEPLQALAVEVAGQGAPGRVLAMAADLRRPDMGRRVVSRASLAFCEISGLVMCADGDAMATTPPTRDRTSPFWEFAAGPPQSGEPADIFLPLVAPAVRQFRARGWGRVVIAAAADGDAAFRLRIAGWANDLEGTGVTANLVIAGAAPTDSVAAAITWLLSEESDGFSGQRLAANEWDRTLAAPEAARESASPIG